MDSDIFHRMVQEGNSQLDISSMVRLTPQTDVVLPVSKIWSNKPMAFWSIKAIILSISRDAFNIGMALDRLESPDNNHARHMVIDRLGKIYLAAGLTTALRHVNSHRRGAGDLNNDNTISIELLNCGMVPEKRLQHKRMIMRDTSDIFHYKLPRHNVVSAYDRHYYEIFAQEQLDTLKKLLRQLRKLNPVLETVSANYWPSISYYKLTPVFPHARFGVQI